MLDSMLGGPLRFLCMLGELCENISSEKESLELCLLVSHINVSSIYVPVRCSIFKNRLPPFIVAFEISLIVENHGR